GRTRVNGQVAMARMMGQFAVQQGQQQAEKLVHEATERLTDLGVVPGAGTPPTTSQTRRPAPAAEAASGGAPAHHDRPSSASAKAEADTSAAGRSPSSNGHRPHPPA